jgi:ferrous iron transport protein B
MQLSGQAQKPVNFPGSSVERAETRIATEGRDILLVDLPGINSLTPMSREEELAAEYIQDDLQEDLVICAVLDAAKLSVELRLLRDLYALQKPIVVALNKTDLAASQGQSVDSAGLEQALQVPVVATNGFKGRGIDDLRRALLAADGAPPPAAPDFDPGELAARVQAQGDTGHRPSTAIDRILLQAFFGPLILALVIFATFQLVFTVSEPFMGMVESAQDSLSAFAEGLMEPGALRSFLVDGLINGLGSVLVFLPQIILLIAFVTILEGSGYLARAAFILDRFLSRVGLSGRSFLPLTSSFACAIPGIMATRIIDNERDRLATIAVAPLMSCSARLPVYVVLIGAFFPVGYAGLVLFSLYVLGVLIAVLVAFLLRRTVLRGGRSLLVMELPAYQWPSWRVVGSQVYTASREFLVLAGSIIFATAIIIWATSYYPRPAEIHEGFEQQRQTLSAMQLSDVRKEAERARIDSLEQQAYFEQSFLARAGKSVQPVFAPAGFDWRTTVAILAAFPARELVIPTLGILHSLGDVDAGDFDLESLEGEAEPEGLRAKLQSAKDPDGRPAFNALVALALMVFFALCSQCVATLGTIKRETRSWRWPIFTFTYMTALAWLGAVAVYQLGSLMGFGL